MNSQNTITLPIIGAIYAHYKSTELDPKNCEIINLAKHTETDEIIVIYRPLYDCEWLENYELCVRPVEMFMENVEHNGVIVPRFRILQK